MLTVISDVRTRFVVETENYKVHFISCERQPGGGGGLS